MKSHNSNTFSILESILTKQELERISLKIGVIARSPKKIEINKLVNIILVETQKGSPSFNDIASKYQAAYNENPSKQAVNKKFTTETVELFKKLLEISISQKIKTIKSKVINFNRIIIQDSTIIRLPDRLYELFGGVSNQSAKLCNVRIQCVYDIVSGKFLKFTIDPYRKNDVSVADDTKVKKNDLLIRDRGYFKVNEFSMHEKNGSYCIYRYKFNTSFLDATTKKSINLLKIVEKNKFIDMIVCLNDKKRTKIRLVATPISEDAANERRRKAKKDCRSNPSEEHIKLLGYSIFLTNIPSEIANNENIFLLYSLRWRIEIMFKSWKSNMSFSKVHNISMFQLKIYLYARFILVVIAIQRIYAFFTPILALKHSRYLSLLKTTKYLNSNLDKLASFVKIIMDKDKVNIEKTCDTLAKYCCFDIRKRQNFNRLYESLFLS